MVAILDIALIVWMACFGSAFLVELLLNRRPVIVAISITMISFVLMAVWDRNAFWIDGGATASIFFAISLLGLLPSFAGAGLGRFIRLWVDLQNEELDNRPE